MLIKGLIALAFGTLSLGISEFVAMGVLPYIAQDFNVDIATAGYAISAYAIGVAVGAFVCIIMHTLKLKTILLILIVMHIFGNVLTVLASNFDMLLVGRFVAGFPHGSFFGVGAIIASRLATEGKGTSAVAIMVAGMTVANVFGVPLGTALAHAISWRVIYYIVCVWGCIVFVSAYLWVKDVGRIESNGFWAQFKFLGHRAPWLVLGATLFGNAGIFCVISYISPLMTDYATIPLNTMSALMAAVGISMVICNLVSGKLCDKYTPAKVACISQCIAFLCLIILIFVGHNNICAIIGVCTLGGMLFAISAPEQVSILRTSQGGLILGSSMVQAAFNLGNALGAYVGGIPFAFDLPLNTVYIIGAAICTLGIIALYIYYKHFEHRFKASI